MNGQFGGAKLVKHIHLNKKGRDGLISGIDKLAAAVGSTLGASGRTVVIENDFGGAHITKDGVTVAESIQVQNPVENLGMTMLKQAAKNTASRAGDGTTTSTVLAHSLIHGFNTTDSFSFRDIKNGIGKTAKAILKELDKRAVKVDDKRLEQVSIISANGDVELGKLIASAFRSAGDNGIVTHQASGSTDTYVENVEGTHIKSNSASHHFFTNPEKEVCELEKPLIFLCATSIPNVRRIQGILEHAIKGGRSILLIAPLEAQPIAALAMNRVRGNIKVNVIEPPSFGLKRKDILDDIALLTGAKVVNEELGDALDLISTDVLGEAEKAISDMEGTTLTFSVTPKEIQERIDYLRDTLDSEDNAILSRHLEKRLSLLSGGVAIINVGAETEVELKEKQDRVDDAVQAVKAAKKEGILPGGGAALAYLAGNIGPLKLNQGEKKGFDILTTAIKSPFVTILDNAGLNHKDYDLGKWGEGVDVTDGKVKDMRKAGIIDPVLVTKEALKNAISVATTILSTDAVISNVREE